jgi:DNA-binding response OmpR family regulator
MSNPRDRIPNRVLMVDDNLDNLQVLYQALEEEGYELLMAQSGEEALVTAKEARPALVLLDINMPGLDGYETCRRLKEDPETWQAVVVFLSARGALDDKLKGFDCGAADYIGKPFQFEEVVARVRTHLAAYHRERELEAAAEAAAGEERPFREFTPDELGAIMQGGEGDRVEFKSTLRQNLHNGKPDRRIENACLKTIAAYLNSEGGLLFIGVDDEGVALGLESDNFPNTDKFLLHLTTLVRNHLGGEFAPFTRPSVHRLDDRDVVVVECRPSSEPVYFRRGDDEIFYVRSGPSTQKLLPSEVVAYVSQRRKER